MAAIRSSIPTGASNVNAKMTPCSRFTLKPRSFSAFRTLLRSAGSAFTITGTVFSPLVPACISAVSSFSALRAARPFCPGLAAR